MGYIHANRAALLYQIALGDKPLRDLLEGLSTKEVEILQKHSDLVDKTKEISRMTVVQLEAELTEEYDLEIDEHGPEGSWISTEKVEKNLPEWYESNHCGWFRNKANGEFLVWARGFLMQDVRINLWVRYLEHKKDPSGNLIVLGGYGI